MHDETAGKEGGEEELFVGQSEEKAAAGGSYRDLKVYRLAHALGLDAHALSLRLPGYEQSETGSRLRQAAKSVSAHLVEGFGRRRYRAEWLRSLVFAKASLDETEEHLRYVLDCHPALPGTDVLLQAADALGRRLARFMEVVEADAPPRPEPPTPLLSRLRLLAADLLHRAADPSAIPPTVSSPMIPFVTAFTVFTFAAFAMAMALVLPVHRGLDPTTAWLALSVGALAAASAVVHSARLPANRLGRPKLSPWAWMVFAAFALFALREFCWLMYDDGASVYVGSPNNLGDLSLHLQLARFFANGAPWWPDHPEAGGYRLRYYPGADGFQALLLLAGAPVSQALVWVGLLGSAATMLALYRWGGTFTVAGFLFNGGLWGFRFFHSGEFIDYQGTEAWKNLALAILTTQRPFLFALPAGLLLLAHWREKFFAEPPPALLPARTAPPDAAPGAPDLSSRGLVPFWVEALLYATMPFFHVFAFLFLSLLLGWWFLCYCPRRAMRRHLLLLVGVALAPATFEIALMTNYFHTGSELIHIHWGWMQDQSPFLYFWVANYGLFTLLAPALWLRCAWDAGWAGYAARWLPRPSGGLWLPQLGRAAESAAAFVLPAGVVFVVACVVIFAPWDWDNTKLMIWCYLAALPFIWQTWVRPLAAPLRWPLCAVLFFSGFVSLFGGMGRSEPDQVGYAIYERAEVAATQVATQSMPVGAHFACVPDYNHPLVYCGREIAAGYPGHVWSQGISYWGMQDDLDTVMLGKPGWEAAAARLDVRYVYWGPREQRHYVGSTRPWARGQPEIAAGQTAIYELPPR